MLNIRTVRVSHLLQFLREIGDMPAYAFNETTGKFLSLYGLQIEKIDGRDVLVIKVDEPVEDKEVKKC